MIETTATYTWIAKAKAWGLLVEGDCSPGMTVAVTRKDGKVSSKVIGRILWMKDGVYGATIASKEEAERLAARPKMSFDPKVHRTNASAMIPPDDGTIPFDPPYTYGGS